MESLLRLKGLEGELDFPFFPLVDLPRCLRTSGVYLELHSAENVVLLQLSDMGRVVVDF